MADLSLHPENQAQLKKIKKLESDIAKVRKQIKSLRTRLGNMQEKISQYYRQDVPQSMDVLRKLGEAAKRLKSLLANKKLKKLLPPEELFTLQFLIPTLEEMAASGDMVAERDDMMRQQYEEMFKSQDRAEATKLFEPFQEAPAEEEQRDIRKTYIRLSQQFHPDRAKNEAEKSRFHELQQRIVEAYQQNDFLALQEIEAIHADPTQGEDLEAKETDVLLQKVAQLERELRLLKGQQSRLSQEIKNFRASDMGAALTVIDRSEREQASISEGTKQTRQLMELISRMADGLEDTLKRKKRSPILDELAEVGDMMMFQMHEDEDEDDDFFDDMFFFDSDFAEEEEEIELKFPLGSVVLCKNIEAGRSKALIGLPFTVAAATFDEKDRLLYGCKLHGPDIMGQMDERQVHSLMDEIMLTGPDTLYWFRERQLRAHHIKSGKAKGQAPDFRKIVYKKSLAQLPKAQADRLFHILTRLGPEKSDIDHWLDYFERHLPLPFSAKLRPEFKDYFGQPLSRIDVLGSGMDHTLEQGVFVLTMFDEVPLYIIAALNKKTNYYQLLEDYYAWAKIALEDMDLDFDFF